jgi:glyoxylate reductase
MRVLGNSRRPDRKTADELRVELVELDALLQQSDFVTIHTSLTDSSYHLIGARELNLMKPTAVLANTARGLSVDPSALYQALRDGQLGYAGLDVTEPEPINADNPLLSLDNCVVVPHMASASVSTRQKMAEIAARNLIAGVLGQRLPHCVNPEVYA